MTLTCGSATAKDVLDQAFLRCAYKYVYVKDTLTGESNNDLLILQIGKTVSKCYSYYTAWVDSLTDSPGGGEQFRKLVKQAFATHTDPPHRRMKTFVYKNHPEGLMTVTDGVSTQDYIYTDSLDTQDWTIRDSVKTILGYSVQMAECDFRGRHWTAWFAADIPVSNGPWKLGNLPGLIMEAYDRGKQNHFLIRGLQKVADEPIVFSKAHSDSKKYVRTTRKKFLQTEDRYLNDINGFIVMETGIDLLGDSGKQKVRRYDLLERDYK